MSAVDVSQATYKLKLKTPGVYTFRLVPRQLFASLGLKADETITSIAINIRKENAAQAAQGQTGPVTLTPFKAN